MIDDRKERERQASFNRRAIVLFGAQMGVASLLGARLYRLQVVESDAYQTLAEENRVNSQPLAPPRGEIFDRDGKPLAVNRPNYSIRLIRERIVDVEETLTRLRRILDLSDTEITRIERRLRRSSAFVPVAVKENLSWDLFAQINANAPALPGVEPEVGWVRDYPEADKLAHVIGYVASVTERELERDTTQDPILRMPNARIGKNGVEKAVELELRGKAGIRKIEVNAGGREIRELARDEGKQGVDLDLSIDLDLQRYAMERLTGESAAAVLMDVWTGDVLALASAPAYDPNKFIFGISSADWGALQGDDHDPLRNKAAAGQYPPGSTFKMVTALAALDSGAMAPSDTVHCSGRMRLGNRFFHCWRKQGHGTMRLRTGIKNSCDIYFYEAAKRAGIEKLAETAAKFGVGETPEIQMPNLQSGNLPTPDWLFANRGLRWSGGDTLNVGIGQGALLMTPLQLAVMVARIANGEKQVQARLIRSVNGAEPQRPDFAPLGVDPKFVALVREGMNAVSNEPGGTAYGSRIDDPEKALAGKTGTAQVRRIGKTERDAGVRKNEEMPWELRDHALFVAFAPVKAPRYAISVVVEHGGGGSKVAAPIARDIMMRALYGPEPPLEAYPAHIRPQIEAARKAAEEARIDPDRLFGVVENRDQG